MIEPVATTAVQDETEAAAPSVVSTPADAAALIGRWEGMIRVGSNSVPVVVRVSENESGRVAVADSPSQGARDIPISDLSLDAGVVRFALPMANARFEGSLADDGSAWVGAWFQGTGSVPLILMKVDADAEQSVRPTDRPQLPIPPFPYVVQNVTFANADAGLTLAGTLTTPEGSGPFPAVVLLTGSGAQDRDETIAGHKPFAVWADALTRRGIAVLRFDDRGVGGSGGGSMDDTTADFATDARAAMDFLGARPEIDARRIGLMGHSEGASTALIAASAGAPAAFVVMIAGPVVSGADILTEQSRQIVRASGGTPEQVEQAAATQAHFMAAVVDNKDDGAAATAAVEALAIEIGQPAEQAAAAARVMGSGWYRYFAAYDPTADLTALDAPLLALYGDRDRNVPAEQNSPVLARLKPQAEVLVLSRANHLMQPAETGLPSEYATIPQTLAPEAIQMVTDWVARVAGLE